MKHTILLLALVILTSFAYSQTNGSLSGYVISKEDKKSIPGAQVYVNTKNGKIGTVTDSVGHFTIKPLNPGRYDLVIAFTGFMKIEIKDINVRGDFDTDIGTKSLELGMMDTVIIYGNQPPLINKNGGNIIAIETKDITHLPNATDIAMVLQAISSEFFVSDDKKEIHFRGSRNNMTAYLIDGVRVDEIGSLPRFAIGSMTVYAGGIPAKYGDFTGGVVVIETMGYFDWLSMKQSRDRLYKETQMPKTIKKKKKEEKKEVTP